MSKPSSWLPSRVPRIEDEREVQGWYASITDSLEYIVDDTIVTTDADFQGLGGIEIQSPFIYALEGSVVAIRLSGGGSSLDSGAWVLYQSARNVGGTLEFLPRFSNINYPFPEDLGGTSIVHETKDVAAWECIWNLSGQFASLAVKGVLGTSIRWVAKVRALRV